MEPEAEGFGVSVLLHVTRSGVTGRAAVMTNPIEHIEHDEDAVVEAKNVTGHTGNAFLLHNGRRSWRG